MGGLFSGGGFSLGGFNFGGSKDTADYGTVLRRGRTVLDNIVAPADREGFANAQRQFELAPKQIGEGYRVARREVGNAFRGAVTEARSTGAAQAGDALTRLTDAGFSGASSIAANLRVGIGYRTAQAIQSIQDRIGQIGADLAIGEGRDVAGATQALGQFQLERTLAERQRNLLLYQLATGQNGVASEVYKPNDISGPVKGLGEFLSSL